MRNFAGKPTGSQLEEGSSVWDITAQVHCNHPTANKANAWSLLVSLYTQSSHLTDPGPMQVKNALSSSHQQASDNTIPSHPQKVCADFAQTGSVMPFTTQRNKGCIQLGCPGCCSAGLNWPLGPAIFLSSTPALGVLSKPCTSLPLESTLFSSAQRTCVLQTKTNY